MNMADMVQEIYNQIAKPIPIITKSFQLGFNGTWTDIDISQDVANYKYISLENIFYQIVLTEVGEKHGGLSCITYNNTTGIIGLAFTNYSSYTKGTINILIV